jgi:hypothetical protein
MLTQVSMDPHLILPGREILKVSDEDWDVMTITSQVYGIGKSPGSIRSFGTRRLSKLAEVTSTHPRRRAL